MNCFVCGGPPGISHQYDHFKGFFCDLNHQLMFHLQMTLPLSRSLTMGEGEIGTPMNLFLYDERKVLANCRFVVEMGLAIRRMPSPHLVIKYQFEPRFAFLEQFDFDMTFRPSRQSADPLDTIAREVTLMIDDKASMTFEGREMRKLFVKLQSESQTVYRKLGTSTYVDVFKRWVQAGHYEKVSIETDTPNVYRYDDVNALLSHLLLFPHDSLHPMLKAFMEGASSLGIDLTVLSIQDYLQAKLPYIAAPPRIVLPNPLGARTVRIMLPPFEEYLKWEERISNFEAIHEDDFTPYLPQIRKKDCLTILAMDDEDRIVGYTTCHFERAVFIASEKIKSRYKIEDTNLARFMTQDNDVLTEIMSLDGLFVESGWRGGQEHSLAVLLVFYTLSMAQACAAEMGIDRVACNSMSRSTAMIMTDFGASFVNAYRSVQWMQTRVDQRKDTSWDVIHYMRQFRSDEEGLPSVESVLSGILERKSTTSIWEIRRLHEDGQHEMMNGVLSDTHNNNWDTFLSLSVENVRFHNAMAEIGHKVKELGVVKKGRDEPSEREGSEKKRRVEKTSIYFPVDALASFSSHVLF